MNANQNNVNGDSKFDLILREPNVDYIRSAIQLPKFKRKAMDTGDSSQHKRQKFDGVASVESTNQCPSPINDDEVSKEPTSQVSITNQLLQKYADTSMFPHNLKPVYAEFRCSDCKRNWSSGHAWIRMGAGLTQKCRKCKTATVPFKIRHKRKGSRKNQGPHDEEGC